MQVVSPVYEMTAAAAAAAVGRAVSGEVNASSRLWGDEPCEPTVRLPD